MRRLRAAFTLVELLISMAVLLILAALLFPVVSRVREKERQSVCQSNLKQIFAAVQQYVQDNDSRQPGSNWREALTSYTKNTVIFSCPSTPEPPTTAWGGPHGGEYAFYIGFLNALEVQSSGHNATQVLAGVNESILIESSKILVSGDNPFDGFYRAVEMPGPNACGMTTGNGTPDTPQRVSTIHNGGGNHLFYDGHVKWMTPEAFTQHLCDTAHYLQPPFRANGPHIPSNNHF